MTKNFIVRIPEWLHEHLKNEADQTGRSLNQICVSKLETRIEFPPLHPIPVILLKKLTIEWKDFLIGIIHFLDENSNNKVAFVIRNTHRNPHLLNVLWHQVSADFYKLDFETPIFLYESEKTIEQPWVEVLTSGNLVWDKDQETFLLLKKLRQSILAPATHPQAKLPEPTPKSFEHD